MLNFFIKQSVISIGFDIDLYSVNLVALAYRSGSIQLVSFKTITTLSQSSASQCAGLCLEPLSQFLRKLRQQYPSSRFVGNASIPMSCVIQKNISVSHEYNDCDIEKQVKSAISEHISYPLEELAIDFIKFEGSSDQLNNNNICIVACRKEIVESKRDLVIASGVNCCVIDIDVLAIYRTLTFAYPSIRNKTIAIVDVSSIGIVFNVIATEILVHTHEELIRDISLYDEINNQFNISIDEFELMFLQDSLPKNLIDTIRVYEDDVVSEIIRAVQMFHAIEINPKIQTFFVCGEVDFLKRLNYLIESALSIDVFRINIDNSYNLNTSNFEVDESQLGSRFYKSFGLALRGLA